MQSSLRILRGLVEAVGSWLDFETICGRATLFSEAYMTYPIGQALRALFDGEIKTEAEHPAIAPLRLGPGDKPRIDFAVFDKGKMKLALETKWLTEHLGADYILRDLVRLELAVDSGAELAFFILGGVKRDLKSLFQTVAFRSHPGSLNSRDLLPIDHNNVRVLRFFPAPAYRRDLFLRALEPIKDIQLPEKILLQRCMPFAEEVKADHSMVFGWLVRPIEGRTTYSFDQI